MTTTSKPTTTREVKVITIGGAGAPLRSVPFVIGLDMHIIGVGNQLIAPDELSTNTHRFELWDATANHMHEIPYSLSDGNLTFQLADTLVQVELREVVEELLTGFSRVAFFGARREFITINP